MFHLYAKAISFSTSSGIRLESDIENMSRRKTNVTDFARPAFTVFLQKPRSDRHHTCVVRKISRKILEEVDEPRSLISRLGLINLEQMMTYSSATVSVLEDCHRWRKISISSKNL